MKMASCSSTMRGGRDSQAKCSFPSPVKTSQFSSLPFFSRNSRGTFLDEEEQEDSWSGSPYCLNNSARLYERSSYAIPDSSLIRKIVSQIEFYLSDENLSQDTFLMKHVQRNKMGFVSIKLLTSFRRVKYLTHDWKVTHYALQFSELLEISEDGTKVRRKIPVSKYLLTVTPNKMLLAWNILKHEETSSTSFRFQATFLNTITKLFGPFGDINSIRILRPGKKLPLDIKKYSSRYPELLTRYCAVVEYDSQDSAQRAFEELGCNKISSPGQAIKVVSLCRQGFKNKVDSQDNEKTERKPKPFRKWANVLSENFQRNFEESSYNSFAESDSTSVSTPSLPQNFSSAVRFPTNNGGNSEAQSFQQHFFTIPSAGPLQMQHPLVWPPYSSLSAPKLTMSELQKPPNSFWGNRVDTGSLWIPKRPGLVNNQFLKKPDHVITLATSRKVYESVDVHLEVIRLPRGPDDTRGFHNTIGRGKLLFQQ